MSDVLASWTEWLPALLGGLRISVAVTGLCLLTGIPLGLVLALGIRSRHAPRRLLTLAVVEVGRGAPVLILLRFVSVGLPSAGLPPSAFAAAVLALAWTTGAYTSEIVRAGLDAVPHGQREAAAAIGLTSLDALRFVVLPQGLRVALPALLGLAIVMLQASSLCFAIGLPELVSQAYGAGSATPRFMPALALAALLYAAICIPATLIVSGLERRLGRHAA